MQHARSTVPAVLRPLVVALVLLGLAVAAAQVPAGDRLVDEGRFEEAIAAYTRAIGADDTDADAERAVELRSDDPESHFELARALGRAAQYRGVLASLNYAARVDEALNLVLERQPGHASAWHAWALYNHEVPWIAGGRSGRVEPAFERAIELEPDVIAHRLEYARILLGRNEVERARRQLEVAVELRADTYLERQDLEAARELLAELP